MESATRTAIQLSRVVGKEIRVLLLRRDMKQTELAARIGVNEMWLSRRLRGAQEIGLNDLQMIAAALDVEAADLLPREVAAQPSREGRTVVVAGEPGRSTTVANHTLPARPHPVGQHKHSTPHDSTRRPVRLSTKHA